jgi:hypothetical protein
MNKTNNAALITGSGRVSAIVEGVSYIMDTDHPKYKQAIDAIRQNNWEEFVELVNITKQVNSYFSNAGVEIKNGCIFFNNEIIHNTLTKRILDFMSKNLPHEPLLKFFNNLMENPSKRAVDELYAFLEAGELPITEDGHFLAFKNVRSNYYDIHSGTFRNQVGDVCEMPRNRVDEDKERTCSYGLHFCSIKYLPHFRDSDGGKTMILKINPKDVVAIPADYENAKGRCSRYEVVGEYKEDWRSKIQQNESGWNGCLYSSDGGDYDCDYDDDENYDDEYDDEYGQNTNSNSIYGQKPSGQKYWAVRDNNGKFTKVN